MLVLVSSILIENRCMLAPDRPSPRKPLSSIKQRNYVSSQSVTYSRENTVSTKKIKSRKRSDIKPVVITPKKVEVPFWLKCFNFVTHTSSGFSIITVIGCFVVYGLTVSAPSEWTKKYGNLQELQKRERQLIFNNEVLKNQLAEEANEANSGLVTPDLSQSPVFLPQTDVEPLPKEEPVISSPKKIEPIFPIAY